MKPHKPQEYKKTRILKDSLPVTKKHYLHILSISFSLKKALPIFFTLKCFFYFVRWCSLSSVREECERNVLFLRSERRGSDDSRAFIIKNILFYKRALQLIENVCIMGKNHSILSLPSPSKKNSSWVSKKKLQHANTRDHTRFIWTGNPLLAGNINFLDRCMLMQ